MIPNKSKIGRWTVISEGQRKTFPSGQSHKQYLCLCECGTQRLVVASDLNSGKSLSCGCINKERLNAQNTSHGLSRHPMMQTLKHMFQRCYNPACKEYPWYGGRKPLPIEICKEWRENRAQFFADMLPTWKAGLTIDRKDAEGPYSKDNCHWISIQKQQRNKRSNRLVILDGVQMCMTEAAEKIGIDKHALKARLNKARGAQFDIFGHLIQDKTFQRDTLAKPNEI